MVDQKQAVSREDIEALVARAAAEPGLAMMRALSQISAEVYRVQQMQAEFAPVAAVTQVSNIPSSQR